MRDTSTLEIVDAVYLLSILANQPRSIDRFIDYFGGARDLDLQGGDARVEADQTPEIRQ